MDWLPTLLAAAGTAPDTAYPPDGMNLVPWLTQGAAPLPRKLFWRYKRADQQAARDGDWKYLKILDNTFLFDVVRDPMERANLKDRIGTFMTVWSRNGTNGTRRCCRSIRKVLPAASPVSSLPTISVSRRAHDLTLR